MKRVLSWCSISVLVISLTITACVVQQNPVSGNKRAYGYSWEEEIQIGQDADKQIQQQYGVYQNEELKNYVDQVAQDILSVSHMRREGTDPKFKNTEFYFRVLNSPVVNAFALPGGYVYVTRGLLAHLNNEAQLAVVMGHEIGHVAARHASQRAFEQQLGQIALVGGAIAGQELLGLPGQELLNIGGTATQLLFLKYGRDDERESDRLGVEYAAMENYVAAEGADFFTSLKRISESSGQSMPSFLCNPP
ncbi:MAG: M48 family metalloprotease [Balneolaceae bacterium]|nr:M48 family metalloprotease [Balneolaceae bacterium]